MLKIAVTTTHTAFEHCEFTVYPLRHIFGTKGCYKRNNMINQYEVPAYLVDEFPELKEELKSISPTLNIFKSIQCFSDYTKRKVLQHDLQVVKRCFAIAEKIYSNGNTIVRDAIENLFVYSFSSLLNLGGKDEKRELQGLMPLCLHAAYVQQILRSGI